MAITLIVEDGTGKDDANALVSLVNAKAYWDGRGISYAGFTDDALSGAIVRASAFLANAYLWQGIKVNQRAQTMPFPRTGVFDREGWSVLQNEIPREVVAACCELALVEAATPGALNPIVVLADKVTSEQIGPIRMEYANALSGAESSRPVLTIVSDLIDQFLDRAPSDFTLLRM
ncbi:DnaT-like ssDNA-binding protein [Nitrobacteraceae bacterium UC4446_H13]